VNPIKVLVLGTDPGDLPENDRIMWVVLGNKNSAVTDAEHYLAVKKMMDSVDLLAVNFQERNPSFADGVLMQMAYSMSTPIFTVGQGLEVPEFWMHLWTHWCSSLSDLVDHLQAYYC
jgi:hypothetical protein